MVLTQYPTGAILFGIDWQKVERQSDPNYVIEWVVLRCNAQRITVRSVADHTEKTFHSALVFRQTKSQCHRDVQKWLAGQIHECAAQLSRLQKFLAWAEAAAKTQERTAE